MTGTAAAPGGRRFRRASFGRLLPAALMLAFAAMGDDGGARPAEHANRLAGESSPYLLQHQHNPVDWYPWGDEAFEKARREGKPVFLSIGYSTCHWCHVMERESFENAEVAALMNRDFVSIKVDREERPDIDNVYMTACQLLTRSGGWPLTAILTPEGLPFFAGTYFPADDRHGRIGMRSLLPRLAEYWKNHRAEAGKQGEEVAAAVRHAVASPPKEGAAPLDAAFARSLEDELARRFDAVHGGFSDAPKFPPHGTLAYLSGRRDGRSAAMLRKTLDAMQDGGVFDQVGGGFHRYSVDAEWFIPHFEKMLHDNAQLLAVYGDAARRFGEPRYRETALAIVAWLEREMATPEGAYASALDADSEGVEGKYYLWTASEIDAVLGPSRAPLYREAFRIQDRGNTPAEFEEGRGRNLPRRADAPGLARKHGLDAAALEERLSADNAALESVRSRRVHPARDDKVLTSWNALAVSALARASRDLDEPRLLAIARRIADFLLARHVAGDLVWHGSRAGAPKIHGFLEDYAFLAEALLDLSEVSGQPAYADRARRIAAEMLRRFRDPSGGGFFQTEAPEKGERGLLDLAREYLDQVSPSPNGIAAGVLLRLDGIAPDPAFRSAARDAIAAAAPYARTFPSASTTFAALAALEPDSTARRPSSSTSGPVTVSASRRGDGAIAVRFSIEPGWHVQSHQPTRRDLVATRVSIPSGGEALYPAAHSVTVAGETLSVYSGEFSITVEPPPGPPPPLDVEFQACDDSRCLAPVRLSLETPAPTEEKK
jgi:hypothetical protein